MDICNPCLDGNAPLACEDHPFQHQDCQRCRHRSVFDSDWNVVLLGRWPHYWCFEHAAGNWGMPSRRSLNYRRVFAEHFDEPKGTPPCDPGPHFVFLTLRWQMWVGILFGGIFTAFLMAFRVKPAIVIGIALVSILSWPLVPQTLLRTAFKN